MNIDRSAFDLRRELGIIVDDGLILKRLIEVFDRGWDDAPLGRARSPGPGAPGRRRGCPRPGLPP